jgi:signal transduction histidine kinase
METTQILLVDDDPALLQALPQTISVRMTGVQVQTALEASTALSLLQHHDYDAIISDIKMPGMDGLELLAMIVDQHPETPVLLITGHGEHELAIRALRGGAYDYILKPIDRDDFLASLQRALQTRQLRRQIALQQRALEASALSLERQVEQRTRQLLAANASKDALLSIVAHELASPLSSLKGFLQLVDRQLQRADAVEKIRGTLQETTHALRRWERLVQDLLETAHLQAVRLVLHRNTCDLVALCRQVLTEWSAGVETAPTFDVCDEPLEAEVDPQRISQVVLNLLSNARKYSPKGAPIAVQMRRAGEEAVIEVRDQGVGIAAEHLSRLTEAFYRLSSSEGYTGSEEGLGLGLYLAKMILEQHGGRLEVSSQPAQGSTFSIVLPLIPRDP